MNSFFRKGVLVCLVLAGIFGAISVQMALGEGCSMAIQCPNGQIAFCQTWGYCGDPPIQMCVDLGGNGVFCWCGEDALEVLCPPMA